MLRHRAGLADPKTNMSIHETNPLNGIDSHSVKSADTAMSVYEIRHLLSNERRDIIIRELIANDGQVEFDELRDALCQALHGVPIDEVESEERHRLYISLYQTHLPKLKGEGVVTYEKRSGTISWGDQADAIIEYLEAEGKLSMRGRMANAMASLF